MKPAEYLELAARCKELGVKVDIAKLKALTGLEFISDEEQELWTPSPDAAEDKATEKVG